MLEWSCKLSSEREEGAVVKAPYLPSSLRIVISISDAILVFGCYLLKIDRSSSAHWLSSSDSKFEGRGSNPCLVAMTLCLAALFIGAN